MNANRHPTLLIVFGVIEYLSAIDAPGAAPGARFAGPAATPNNTDWCRTVAEKLGPGGKLRLVTQHAYPGGWAAGASTGGGSSQGTGACVRRPRLPPRP